MDDTPVYGPLACDECGRTSDADVQTPSDAECLTCGVDDCPHGEPLHYHHDGCPQCEWGDAVHDEI